MDIVSYVYRMDKKVFYKNFIENYNIFIIINLYGKRRKIWQIGRAHV